ncbi:MAG: DUF58 domain-containing protein [Planctomycetota bacterium]
MIRLENPQRAATIDELLGSELIARIGQLDLSSKKIFAGKLKGERRSKKRGESVEFADHRPYVIGDDPRHIDWNVFGRLDRLFLKLFLEEEDLSLHVVLDASASLDCGNPSKWHYAQQLAMALGYIGLVNLNRVAVSTVGGLIDTGAGDQSRDPELMHAIRDLRGKRRTQELARFICSLRPEGDTNFPEAAKRIALSRRGKGVMVVISDFFMKEGYEQGLRMLVGRGYDVIAIQLLSPQEVEPEGPSGILGDLRLVDTEDGDRAEITVSAPLLKKYKATLNAYCQQLRDFCARREMTAMTVRSDTPVDTLLLDYLRKRGVLR